MSAALSPDRILREMADLWVGLGKPGQAETGMGVLRACSMTLVVIAQEREEPMVLGETIAALLPRHPARAIVIGLRPEERQLAARVTAGCWMPFGQRRQICSEQIEITGPPSALADVVSVISPLAAPDLPLIVWCRNGQILLAPEFASFSGMARKLVVDSTGWPDPKAALERLAGLAGRGIILGDLSWTRLTRWREALSQVFANPAHAARLPEIARVRVRFGPNMAVMARYMGAWLLNSLKSADVRAELSLEPGLEALAIELAGERFRLELAREGERLVTRSEQLSRCTSLPEAPEYLLLSEELGILRHDPIFERTLASAVRL
jgi:glucose-6-phosphate dehydrogenase assembly protein OpcA